MRALIILFAVICFSYVSHGQMTINGELRYGNEWIDYDTDYYKIRISEDGIFKITRAELVAAGMISSQIIGADLRVHYMGEEISIIPSTDGLFGEEDYVLFIGEKNRGSLDRHLYQDWSAQMLNPDFSMFTDTSSYFLSINDGTNKRFEERDNNVFTNVPDKEEFYFHEEKQVLDTFYHKPSLSQNVRFSTFETGEGFGNQMSKNHNFEISTSNVFRGSQDAKARFSARTGSNGQGHLVVIKNDNQTIFNETYNGHQVRTYDIEMDVENMDNVEQFNIQANASTDNITIAHVALTYPRSFDFQGRDYFEFKMEGDFFEKYIEIENFNSGQQAYLVDLTNALIISGVEEDGLLKFRIPPSTKDREMLVFSESSAPKQAIDITRRKFVDYASWESAEYIILTSRNLDKMSQGENPIQSYADYRKSLAGGEYGVAVVHSEELYDQFAYGVSRHNVIGPNFFSFIKQHWTTAEYVYALGKGVEYGSNRLGKDIQGTNLLYNHVPTFGVPGSDLLMVSPLNDNRKPIFKVGRLAANNAEEIMLYLDKVRLHDAISENPQTIEGKLWSKRLIHLSGGDATIQELIFNYLEVMRNEIEGNQFGGEVTTFRKFDASNLQTSTSQEILGLVNDGVAMITFFGHSAPGTFDFSLEDPSQYSNYGKYPMIVSLGCLSGNVFSHKGIGLSEDFVIERDKAAIAFLASTGAAHIVPQGRGGEDLYRLLGDEMYGGNISDAIYDIVHSNSSFTNTDIVTLMQQLLLHGDPVLKLNPHEGPDYVVDRSSVGVNPKVISAQDETFELFFDVVNLGAGVKDSLDIRLIHKGPNGDSIQTEVLRVEAPGFRGTTTVTLNGPGEKGLGKNLIEIEIDVTNRIEEVPLPTAESNNRLVDEFGEEGYCFYVLDNGAKPIYPSEFAIINNECPFELKASTTNAFLDEQKYLFEIDTTALFDSPSLVRGEVVQVGGLISWDPGFAPRDGQVYYWRVSPDSINPQVGYLWEDSSFIYEENGELGWNQSHYYQFLKDDLTNFQIDSTRRFDLPDEFFDMVMNVQVPNGGVVPRMLQNSTPSSKMKLWELPLDGIGVAVKRNFRFTFIENSIPGDYGSYAQGGTQRIFFFRTDEMESRIALVNFLEDIVDSEDHVFLFTVTNSLNSDLNIEQWAQDSIINSGKNIFNVLESQGANLIRNLLGTGTVPYSFFYSKDIGARDEGLAQDIGSSISLNSLYTRNLDKGHFFSTAIGPVGRWDKIVWNLTDEEPNDSISLSVIGIDGVGNEQLIVNNETSREIKLNSLNESSYKFLKIKVNVKDEVNYSSPQIEFIKVFFDDLPDLSLDLTNQEYTFNSDTLFQGQDLEVNIPIVNYTSVPMGPTLCEFSIIDELNNTYTDRIELDEISAKTKTNIVWSFNTSQLSGLQRFSLTLNPLENPSETYYFNNFGIREFIVQGDRSNPLLDVTFDGVHIVDGDYVSSNPEILLKSKDENKHLLLNDPELFELRLNYPDQGFENISMDDPRVEFFAPTNGEDNVAELLFKPILSVDGTHELEVQTRDASGNFSGENAYKVTFEIDSKKRISNVLNYPNPFSTNTQFVFTVTGDVPPTEMMINIYTLSGKLVRQIRPEEIGPIKIGVNRTSFKWDGTDEFGQKLASGIYLYKPQFADEHDFEDFGNLGLDDYFNQGFGKMVIIR